MDGGYDDGYKTCPCFWGREPGSLVQRLMKYLPTVTGLSVLDVGCGEGKNSVFLAQHGAVVRALDVSALALSNARQAWLPLENIIWEQADIRAITIPKGTYDIVIAYGLLHCLSGVDEIRETIQKLQCATKNGGYNLICVFNGRYQDLSAHPGFMPCLLKHDVYVQMYSNWQLLDVSDTDLFETHPHNSVPHTHSLTRMITRKIR